MTGASLESKIYSALVADPDLFELIGARLHLVQIPQNPTFPCVRYQRISTQRLVRGGAPGPDQQSVGWARIQFDCYADGPSGGQTALEVFDALRKAMLTFNAAAAANSPKTLTQSPNTIINDQMMIYAELRQPVMWYRADFRVWFNDEVN